jgi:hypothetical protein
MTRGRLAHSSTGKARGLLRRRINGQPNLWVEPKYHGTMYEEDEIGRQEAVDRSGETFYLLVTRKVKKIGKIGKSISFL